MRIGGLQKLTLLDYPDKMACIVFTEGCNLRCPFCHNAPLVLRPGEAAGVDEDEFFAFLDKRKGLLDGVVITGGEPLLNRDLPEFIRRIREKGYAVKLDTNGTLPDELKGVLPLVDYVAMDIKNSPENYAATVGGHVRFDDICRSVDLIRASNVDHEFRTTVVKPLFSPEDFDSIGRWLQGEKRYFLQKFKDSGDLVDGQGLSPYSDGEMQYFLGRITPYIPTASLRG